MKIYLYLDNDDAGAVRDLAESMVAAMATWLIASRSSAALVDCHEGGRSGRDIGLTIDTNRRSTLAKPLDFLYELATAHQQEFVIGIVDEQAVYEDICYFGFEEGKPDIHEVASYLGLPK